MRLLLMGCSLAVALATTACSRPHDDHRHVVVESANQPGFLVLVCEPTCDDIALGERSLGPSPLVKTPLPSGRHALTLRAGALKKSMNVDIVPGETTAARVAMK